MAKEPEQTILQRLLKSGFPIEKVYVEAEHQYVAKLILDSPLVDARSRQPWDFKPLADWADEDFVRREHVRWTKDDSGRTTRDWVEEAQKNLTQCAVHLLHYEEAEGLRFYVPDNGSFREAYRGDESYEFMCKLREQHSLWDMTLASWPKWTKDLHVGNANFEAYATFWFDNSYLTDRRYGESRTIKAQAVAAETARRMGGVALLATAAPKTEPGGARWPAHETKHLTALRLAAVKFWSNYDPADQTTAPTNPEVSHWLQQHQGVSETLANSMATILRSDGLKLGPRKSGVQ